MESFYGGRQGISFIIVKHFDGINIPQSEDKPIYNFRLFAYDEDYNEGTGGFIIEEALNPVTGKKEPKLIAKTADNYTKYNSWKHHALNGEEVSYKIGETTLKTNFPIEKAYGMVQCFEQGGITTNEVNYGEYVIIDTADKNNPDNGKIYRRGLNYQYDSVRNPLAGAEYIGQIVGPEGKASEISIDNFDFIVEEGGPENKKYNMTNGGVIKGVEEYHYTTDLNGLKVVDEKTTKFNDDIKYTWVAIKDEFGVITGCKIGFVFPTLDLNFTASAVSAYETINLIQKTDSGKHPYFSQWHISVPKGVKGNALDDLEIEGSLAFKGTPYYADKECETLLGQLNADTAISFDDYKYEDETVRPILDPTDKTTVRYIKKPSLTNNKCVLVYKETNYDKSAKGESQCIVLGEYNMIEKVSLSDKGILTVSYTYDNPTELEHAIRWLHPGKSIEIKNDGTIVVNYNTTHKDETGKEVQDSDTFEKKLKWIDDVWIESTGGEKSAAAADKKEGDGDQKVHIYYNNELDENNKPIDHALGSPINYIMETIVTKLDNNDTELKNQSNLAENYHLLVLYSDPEYRNKLKTQGLCKTWRSNKFTDTKGKGLIRTDWYDMGYVRGEAGGIHIIATLTEEQATSMLIPGNPPETIMNDHSYAGWSYAVGDSIDKIIYFYDYVKNDWAILGSVGSSAIEPNAVIMQATSVDDATMLNTNGILLMLEESYSVY